MTDQILVEFYYSFTSPAGYTTITLSGHNPTITVTATAHTVAAGLSVQPVTVWGFISATSVGKVVSGDSAVTETLYSTTTFGLQYTTTYPLLVLSATTTGNLITSQSSPLLAGSTSSTSSTPSHSATSAPNTSTIIPAIVVPVVIVAFLAILGAFCLIRRHRRRHAVGNTEIFRTESNIYRKPELEGTPGIASFESQPKPELAGTPKHRWSRRSRRGAELDGTLKSKRSARNRKTTSETTGQSVVYQEKEAVQPTQVALTHIPELPSVRDHQPMTYSTDEIQPAPMNSSRSASANEETNLLRAGLMKSSSPTYSASTEPTPQAQAAVDASQINKLKAQERELAEYIDAHETLQKLKNEHVALQERIKAAEERAQRLKVSGAD
jgi:hypothetical protein